MASVKNNILANLAGNTWSALMGFIFVPVYLHYLGAEGFGLIGFFATLSAILTLFDAGFGAAAARQLARWSKDKTDSTETIGDLVRTLEWLFWGGATICGAILILFAHQIADRWLNLERIDLDTATDAVRLMGIAFILQWPITFYNGCLIGLQRQVLLNALSAPMSTIRWGGGALILWLVSPSVEAFFAWQVVWSLLCAVSTRFLLWRAMPITSAPSFELGTLRAIGRFAIGVAGINIFGLLLTHLDKLILSTLLPLKEFGYYMLAWTLAALLYKLIGPIFTAIYPRLTQLVLGGDTAQVVQFYKLSAQILALVMVPCALILVFFGKELMFIWTGDKNLAIEVEGAVALLALGTMFNGLIHMPYALQLAHGWTSLTLRTNAILVILIGPLTYWLATSYGFVGAAFAWPLLNGSSVVINGWLTHRRLLPAVVVSWLTVDVLAPIIAVSTLLFVSKQVLFREEWAPTFTLVTQLLALALFCFVSLGFLLPHPRKYLFELIRGCEAKWAKRNSL